MIQDIEGATTEPSRRRHVALLSASVAAVSLVLFYVLVAPATRMDTPPLAASPASRPTDGMLLIYDSAGTRVWLDEVAPVGVDFASTACAVGIGSSPPVHLLFDRDGRPIAAYTGGKTGRFIPLPQAYVGSGWLTVPCDTSDVFAPRLNRAR